MFPCLSGPRERGEELVVYIEIPTHKSPTAGDMCEELCGITLFSVFGIKSCRYYRYLDHHRVIFMWSSTPQHWCRAELGY